MLNVANLKIKEVVAGPENSADVVTLRAVNDETGAVAGECALSPGQMFLTLECSVETEEFDRSTLLSLLTTEALKIAHERFPKSILIVSAKEQESREYEQFGFIQVAECSSGSPRRLLFPPSRSRLKMIVGNNSCSHSSSTCEICELLKDIESLKYVPLVVLHRLMDARKLGLSIVRTFVRLAMAVQVIQREQPPNTSLSPEMSIIVKDEELLLALAWEKLNTGHFSEVDECWRQLYAAVSLVKSVRLSVSGEYLQAIASADLGLLMGEGIPDQLLQRYAQFCDRLLPPPRPILETSEISLVVPKPLPNSNSIPVFNELSKWDFIDQFLSHSKPAIVRGLIAHWPAVKTWK
ncbi:hypothetical protein KIN20_026959 [Parelaphostrongylus tenuis]|uniref:DM8 domain-containing protein n=1 Tax=Parelaphostrongylus tenuis TaxID=148309 RepID=A0AAD5WDM6_PARTN|nr:hypothetical protein KIN20_026959 [Parelaphostrongylus tenuis]